MADAFPDGMHPASPECFAEWHRRCAAELSAMDDDLRRLAREMEEAGFVFTDREHSENDE